MTISIPFFYFTHTTVNFPNSNSGGFFRIFGYGLSWTKWLRPSLRWGKRKYVTFAGYYWTVLKP